MARPCRSVTSTVGCTPILPPRCMANTGSSVAVDAVDPNMGYPCAQELLTVIDGRGDDAHVRRGVPCSHCATERRPAAGICLADGVILGTGNRPLHRSTSLRLGTESWEH